MKTWDFLHLAEWLWKFSTILILSLLYVAFFGGMRGFSLKGSGLYHQPHPCISGSWHCYLLCVICSSFFILGNCLGFSLEKASPLIQGLCLYYLPNPHFLQPCFLYSFSLKLLFCRFWMLIWSANFFFKFFGLLICFLGEIFPPLFLSALPLSFMFILFYFALSLNSPTCFVSFWCLHLLFWFLTFESFWERSLAFLYIHMCGPNHSVMSDFLWPQGL